MFVHNSDHNADVSLFNLDTLLKKRVHSIGEILRRSVEGGRRKQYRKTNDRQTAGHNP
jgi:hypothetical protein